MQTRSACVRGSRERTVIGRLGCTTRYVSLCDATACRRAMPTTLRAVPAAMALTVVLGSATATIMHDAAACATVSKRT